VEGLRDGVVQEGPDRRQAACMHRRGKRPDLACLHLQGVGASQVPVVAVLVQVQEKLGQQLVAFFPQRGLVIRVIGTSGLLSS